MKEVPPRNIRSRSNLPSSGRFFQLSPRKPTNCLLFGWIGNLTYWQEGVKQNLPTFSAENRLTLLQEVQADQSIKICSWRPINAFVWPFPFLVIYGCCVTWWFIARVQAYFLSPLTCSHCHVNCECHIKLALKSDKSTENLIVQLVTFFPSHAYFQNPWPVGWLFHTAWFHILASLVIKRQ